MDDRTTTLEGLAREVDLLRSALVVLRRDLAAMARRHALAEELAEEARRNRRGWPWVEADLRAASPEVAREEDDRDAP